MQVLLVGAGGALGATLRLLIDRRIQRWHGTIAPWGTFTVNIVGSFILGILSGLLLASDDPVWLLLGTGLCGALTTYSTFAFEAVRLGERGRPGMALGYVAGTVALGVAAAAAGFALA